MKLTEIALRKGRDRMRETDGGADSQQGTANMCDKMIWNEMFVDSIELKVLMSVHPKMFQVKEMKEQEQGNSHWILH